MNINFLQPGGALGTALFDEIVMQERCTRPSLPVGHVLYPFQIGDVLGKGGQSIVYEAHRIDGKFEQTVALKVFTTTTLDSSQFIRECTILASLEHPNIARIIDANTGDDHHPWCALERVQGQNILSYCAEHNPSVEQRIGLLVTISTAIHHAHEHGIIHGDIKAENVLVRSDGMVKLLDFGIARLINQVENLQSMTLAVASPEQRRGERLTTSSDLFQLGLLMKDVLFAPQGYPHSAREKHLKKITQLIIEKCLANTPTQRYGSVIELQNDLLALLKYHPPRSIKTNLPTRLALLHHRHPAAVPATVLLLCISVLLLLLFNQQINEAATHKKMAQEQHEIKQLFLADFFQQIGNIKLPEQTRNQVDHALQVSLLNTKKTKQNEHIVADVLAGAYLDAGLPEQSLALSDTFFGDDYVPQKPMIETDIGLMLKRADAYTNLRDLDRAAISLNTATNWITSFNISDSRQQLYAEVIKAKVQLYQGNDIASMQTTVQAIERFSSADDNANHYYNSLLRLAYLAYQRQEQWPEAIVYAQKACHHSAQVYGALSSNTLDCARDLVSLYLFNEQYKAADELIAEQEKQITQHFGRGDLDALMLQSSKALSLFFQKKYSPAAEIWQNVIEQFRSNQFDNAAQLALLYHHLGSAYTELGEWQAAINALEQAMQIRKQTSAEFVPELLSQARAYCELNQSGASLAQLQHAIIVQQQLPFTGHDWLADTTQKILRCSAKNASAKTTASLIEELIRIEPRSR